MPAWWKGIVKGKSKTISNSSASSEPSIRSMPECKEEEEAVCALTPRLRREVKNEKANSFDGVILDHKAKGTAAAASAASRHGGESVFAFGHPLPRPSSSSPLPFLPPLDAVPPVGSGSASASSISSSGSSDDAPDLGFYRLSETITVARGRQVSTEPQRHLAADRRRFSCSPVLEHPRSYELPVSPKKEIHLQGFNAMKNDIALSTGVTYSEIISNPRRVSCAPSPRGSPLSSSPRSSSPIHPVALRVCPGSPTGRQDELRSPCHPLPLPPISPTSSTSFSPRSSRAQWKKGKLLGRGTFGQVYLGFNSENGQMCAIKEVTVISDDSNSRESLKQLNQEINLLSQLSHPNIVQYYGSDLVDETLAVYLEYVSGGSIHKLLQDYGPFGEPVIRNYTAQVLCGLAYLHGRNTMHRDIKGANILVDPNGEVKLADFGMAKHISSYTSIRSFKGSPYWMAPEVIMNVCGYNLSVDIWSLGCTVLEMATSKPPWSQFEGVAAIFKIGNSKDIPDIPDQLSSEAKSFLRLCLLRDPSARPTAAQLMNHPFVCDQPTIKAAKSCMANGMLPLPDGNYSAARSFRFNGSISPQCERHYMPEHWETEAVARKSTSDLMGMRMNMSLPVSPCSSPLRQFKQGNRTCLPSPTHPAFSAGAVPYGPSSYHHQARPSHNFADPSLDISEKIIQAPFNRQRR